MADFRTAVSITMDPAHEGGFQALHNDKGNWTGGEVGAGELKGTKYGISAAEFPDLDIKNLTTDQAAAIYKDRYWKPLYSQINDQLVANKLFDMGVLFGVGTAVKMLQTAMEHDLHVVSDGDFGPETLASVNQEQNLLPAYKQTMLQHCINVVNNNPQEGEFVQDWIRRINS
jgi:lysozyme family protein